MSNIIKPNRFVGLHAHSGLSVFDGLGPPQQHIDFVMKNGMDAWALTDHGHMNGFAQAYLYAEKLHKAGKNFKYIPGVEAYVHPDLNQWRADKLRLDEISADAKKAKTEAKKNKEKIKTEIKEEEISDDIVDTTNNALTIENEDETKSNKIFNPINRRHHLVMLPKTSRGLQKLFKLVSKGYLDGFYRFPRIDLGMIKEVDNGEGDLILSSACIGGHIAWEVFNQLREFKFEDLNASILDDQSILNKLMSSIGNTYEMYVDAVGKENYFLELQFNKLPSQDVVNRAIIEFAKKEGITKQLVATADSHYPGPDLWYHREMYKKLGYLNYTNIGPESLPKSKDDLKADLYPKNAEQMWDEYLASKSRQSYYDSANCDQIVSDAIERSHDIAHHMIGNIEFDKSYKYPSGAVPKGKKPFNVLVEKCKEGLKSKNLDQNQEYVDRLKYELTVIKKLDNANYFVTLARALELSRGVCLLGVARGSSGGSLVAYLMAITDLDPIKYGCQFERFMSLTRVGAPDIDCDVGDRDAVIDVLRKEFGYNNVIPISNYNQFKVKSLIKDLARFYGIPYEEVNEATKTVEQEVRKATQKHGDDKNLFVLTFDDAMKYSPSFSSFIEKHPQIAESMNVLFKEQRSLGRHAGGVCILDDALSDMPLIVNSGEPQTPWVEGVGGKTLEPLGIIKYDLLGLETMRLISDTIKRVIKNKVEKINIELENGKMISLFSTQIVKTNNGEKLAKDLTENDEILND